MTNESGLLFDKENEDYKKPTTIGDVIEYVKNTVVKDIKQENDIDSVLKQRGEQYGEFKDHAILSQALKNATRLNAPDYMRESMEMICHKQARIVNGNPAHIDLWRAIAGYAMLVVKELEKGDCDE